MQHIKYRKDLDGLRSFAVISVILFHAFPKLIKGGFVGVDIFFVLSGYLITRIIYKNLNTRFSFYEFYARRVKRIFPALILVISSCIIFGYFALFDTEYANLGNHVKASAFIYMNFNLWKESGYFDISSNLKPLLHLWSLSVEEQFYFLWPLILIFSWKKGFNNITISIAIICISFFINIKLIYKDPIASFYFPTSRAWELMSGCLLAQLIVQKTKFIDNLKEHAEYFLCKIFYSDSQRKSENLLQNTVSIIGFALNLSCIIFFNKINKFPGWYALMPVIGTVFIIAAGPNAWVNKKILSNKIMVWIGLISYPLYLWHWPLLSYSLIVENGSISNTIIFTLILISIFLSWATYQFIEKPIRNSNRSAIVALLFITVLSLGLLGHIIYENKGYPSRTANEDYYTKKGNAITSKETFKTIQDCRNIPNLSKNMAHLCHTNSSSPKFAIIGDSHSVSLGYAAIILPNLDIISFSYFSCLPFKNYIAYEPGSNKKETIKLYKDYTKNLLELTKINSIEYIVLLNRGPVYISGHGFGIESTSITNWRLEPINKNTEVLSQEDIYVSEHVKIINELLASGKKVIFSIDYPELGIDPLSCINRPLEITNKNVNKCIIERKDFDDRNKLYRKLVARIKEQVPSLIIYDPTDAFCDKKYCYGEKNNRLLYIDHNHLNNYGAKILINDFINWLKKLDNKIIENKL